MTKFEEPPLADSERAPRWTRGAWIAATLATLYALLITLAWAMESDLGWSAWPPGLYVQNGVEVLGLFIAPVAVVLGWRFPFHSWRWGLWLTWPQVLLGFSLHRGCPIAPPCASVDVEPALMPAPLIAVICLAAWLGVRARRYLVERRSPPLAALSNRRVHESDATAHRRADVLPHRRGRIAAETVNPHHRPNTSRSKGPELLSLNRNRARIVVFVAFAALVGAFQSQPRNIPILLASAVGLLYGLWLLLGGGDTAGRMWGVLVAGLIGGVLGFVALIDLIWSATNADWDGVVAGYVLMAGRVWPFAVASGLLFALVWPEWWWRWGLILSWAFIVTGVTAFHASVFSSPSMPELFLSRAPLLLVPLPVFAAAVGAFVRGALPLKALARATRDSDV